MKNSAGRKIRLDQLLVERGWAESRNKAQALILAGRVRTTGLSRLKSGAFVPPDLPLELTETARFVSRGGEKLEGAVRQFSIEIQDRVCLDVGASTGGFTDCLLQHGARKVIAVDVGHGQLHWKLRGDPRVVNHEKTHALRLEPRIFGDEPPDFVTVDVSFISSRKVMRHLAAFMPAGTEFITLVKPQFEAGPADTPKGIVRNPAVREKIIREFENELPAWGLVSKGWIPSPLKGVKGNIEYLFYSIKK